MKKSAALALATLPAVPFSWALLAAAELSLALLVFVPRGFPAVLVQALQVFLRF